MNTTWFQVGVKAIASRAIGQANISASRLAGFNVPVPSLDEQARVVSTLNIERPLVESNRKLIQIFEAKIKAKLDQIWGTVEEADKARATEDVQIGTQEIGGSLM